MSEASGDLAEDESSMPLARPEMSQYTTLTVAIADQVAEVCLNRPESANAMNAAMWPELEACFNELDANEHVRAIVLAGNGKHFCAGIDLLMLQTLSVSTGDPARASERLRDKILELQGNLSAIEACRKPVVAAIQGACLGGGVDIISCCDMRYANADARFAIREIDIGLVADVGSLQRLPYLIGEGMLRELAFTGRDVDAEEAQRIGLVNRVFPDYDSLRQGVREIAVNIAQKSPLAVRGTKQVLDYGRSHNTADGLAYVATWNSAMLSFGDVKAALAAAKSRTLATFDD